MSICIELLDSENDVHIAIRVGGGYNPDVLEDVKRRVGDLYQEALATNLAVHLVADDEMDEEVTE